MKRIGEVLQAPVLPPVQAVLGSLVVAIGNAAIALGVLGVSTATRDESIVVGAIAVLFPLWNALHAHAQAKIEASRITMGLRQ